MEIVPGVHRIPGITGSNACLLAGEQMAVVDAGIHGNSDAIISYIKSIGRSPSDLKWVVLTHFHYDHSGSALELHDLTGAQIVTHKDEIEAGTALASKAARIGDGRVSKAAVGGVHSHSRDAVEGPVLESFPGRIEGLVLGKVEGSDSNPILRKGNEADSGRAPWWVSFLMGGRRRDSLVPHATPVHLTVDHNEVLPCLGGLRILHTPGHTPGSVCLYLEKEKVLFLGDSVLNNVDRLSRPIMYDKRRRMQLDSSLRTLRGLEAEAASFGHGPPLREDVMTKVRALTDRPYNLSTWRIVLKNWRTLRAFRASTKSKGHWSGVREE